MDAPAYIPYGRVCSTVGPIVQFLDSWPDGQACICLTGEHICLTGEHQILWFFSKLFMVYFIVSKKALSASFLTALFLVMNLLFC